MTAKQLGADEKVYMGGRMENRWGSCEFWPSNPSLTSIQRIRRQDVWAEEAQWFPV